MESHLQAPTGAERGTMDAHDQERRAFLDARKQDAAKVEAFAAKIEAFVRANAPEGTISIVKVELTHEWDSSLDETLSINLEEG